MTAKKQDTRISLKSVKENFRRDVVIYRAAFTILRNKRVYRM